MRLCPESNGKLATGRTNLPADRWYTSVLPIPHGCMNTNIENARKYSRFAVEAHCVPITPHLLFPQFLDDRLAEDRQTAMSLNQVLLEKCSQLWVFGSVRSEGMQQEIQWAKQRQITIRYFTEELEEIE